MCPETEIDGVHIFREFWEVVGNLAKARFHAGGNCMDNQSANAYNKLLENCKPSELTGSPASMQ